MSTPAPDASICPLCGGPNACGAARGASTCWCAAAVIPVDVIARVPPEDQGVRCICAACAAGGRDAVPPGRAAR